jgi:hypothetical protein
MTGLRPTISLDEVLMGLRFLRQLPGFLRHPVTLDEARATLRKRLARREADFLSLVGPAVYGSPSSPYLAMLRLAGCEYGDLEQLVTRDGVDGALQTLLRRGVYLTVDEFKGRRAVVRGGSTILVRPDLLRNRRTGQHMRAWTSGSRGNSSPVAIALPFVRDHAVNLALLLEAQGGRARRYAVWGVPGGTGILFQLFYAAATGRPPDAWFSPVDPEDSALHPRYRWSGRLLRWIARIAGASMPRPVYVPLDDPRDLARWAESVISEEGTPHIWTSSSAAVRLALTARDQGIGLRGTQFLTGMEPTTAARLDAIHAVGASAVPTFGSIDTGGPMGVGCLRPDGPDDIHVFHDLHAMIRTERAEGPFPSGTLLISTLRPTSPVVLLNVCLGDQGVTVSRPCGCPLERLGWTTHVHTIRSFEKLTAAGMNFLDTDVVRVLEEVLPSKFGGGPTDYQLVETTAQEPLPTLKLLVHPRLGELDTAAVASTFIGAIGAGSGATRLMSAVWKEANVLLVERRPPIATASGKILHLHVQRP